MFKQRSDQKEMLDEVNINKNLLYRNLFELEIINKFLGGHRVSISGIKKLIGSENSQREISNLIDIGSGGGDSLKAISSFLKKKKNALNLTGIDLKQDCVSYAQLNCKNHSEIKFICDDFRNIFKNKKIDIVHAALFCHHFKEDELISFIKLCNHFKSTFIINDLERNPIAYYSIWLLTKLFSKSPLVKNDAPLSVLRGFKKKEWKIMIEKAGIKKYHISNKWAFRHLIIIYPN